MGKGTNTTSSSSSISANPVAAQNYYNLLGTAANVASTPYQSYTGQLTAPINSQQQAGVAGINANANYASPFIQQAAGLATGAANPLTATQIQNYQNPYTQQVVNATEAQMQNQDAQQQAALTGNTIAQGALGGNRAGVAQGVLAGQQALANNSTIAGLYNQGYTQALQTAQQQYQQNPLAAASSIANFGIQGQNAALSGANTQLGAGTLEQQTQQAQDTALYNQYVQQQAYPFQTAQWLAGLDTSLGSALGSTTSGATTGPAPNQTAQYLGAGIAGAGLLLSDRRAKKNIQRIGRLNDGQPLYRYKYEGSDTWHIGPIAQEVEKHHPEAVHAGLGGLKYVDLKAATDDSVRKAHGGSVAGLAVGGTPWSFADGWVPTFTGSGRGLQSSSAPSLPNTQTPALNTSQLGNIKLNSSGLLSSNPAYGGGNAVTAALGQDAYGGSSSDPLPGLTAADYGEGFARGGVAGFRGYADGGSPDDDPVSDADRAAGLAMLRDQMAPTSDMPVFGSDGRMMGNMTSAQGQPPAPDVPVVAKGDDDDQTASAPQAGVAPLVRPTVAPAQPFARDDAQAGFGKPSSGNDQSSFGLGLISPNAQSGLLAAGLGMLASRSPFLGNAVGEGGLAGLNAYSASQAADLKAKQDELRNQQENRRIEMEAQRLQQEAQRTADDFALRASGQKETARHNLAQEQKEYKPTWGVIGEVTDPQSGTQRKTYGWIDPNKKAITDAQGKPVAASPSPTPPPGSETQAQQLEGDEWAKTVPPDRAFRAKMIANYEESPSDLPTRGGLRSQAVADAKHFNKDYNEQNYQASQRAYTNFNAGQESRTVRSLNVATDHLDTLRQAADALNNGDYRLVNAIVNKYREETGSPLVANFDSIKQAVSSEIAKVVVGGQTALQDRDEMANRAKNSDSPAVLHGIFDGFTKLMGGQMKGLKQQYESTTYRKDFDKYLLPSTKNAINAVISDPNIQNTWQPTQSGAPAAAVDLLRKNPALAPQFDAKYGQGASRQYLGAP